MTSASAQVSRVDVVFKTHLDIGFTDFAQTIVHRYVTDFIPAALKLARDTRKSPHRFVWTTGAWLVHHYLDSAGTSGRRRMEEAIAAGDFHWHALPFTMQTEFVSRGLFQFGLEYSRILDRRFGRTTRSAKATDVPGHTAAMIPLLAGAGIRFLHIGVNPGSSVPEVPPVFRWRRGSDEIVVIYEDTYGGVTRLPRGRALCVNLTGDNLGPQSPREVAVVYERLQKEFPGAEVRAGSLEESAGLLWRYRAGLPVIEQEIGDTWIHGMGTDPAKVAAFRALSRLREGWIADGRLKFAGKADMVLGGNLLLVAEHTWGLDVKSHLKDWKHYCGEGFRRARRTGPFRKMERSWQEQRAYLDRSLALLPADLKAEASACLAELKPALNRKRLSSHNAVEESRFGRWTVQTSGGRVGLCCDRGIRLDVDFVFETFSGANYRKFYRDYIRWKADWSRKDFTKPGLPSSVTAGRYSASWSGWTQTRDGWLLGSGRLDSRARRNGSPGGVRMGFQYRDSGLDVRLEWSDKPANRRPEAIWLIFQCRSPRWQIRKLGRWIDSADVVKKGARWLHATDGEVRVGDLRITSPDAALVGPAPGRLLDFSSPASFCREGIAFNLLNNVWGTNFPMWYDEDGVFRFHLES